MNDNGEILIYETWKSREKLNNTISNVIISLGYRVKRSAEPNSEFGQIKKI